MSFDVTAVCRLYGLGDPLTDPAAVPGARSHTLWRLTTSTGRYAVKVFDRHVDHTRSPEWRSLLDEAVGVELAAWRAGLPLPRPVAVAGGPPNLLLGDVPDADGTITVRVHAWADGAPVPDSTADPALADAVGELLARVHLLGVPSRHDTAVGLWQTQSDRHLTDLAAAARRAGRPWADDVDRARDAYAAVRDLAELRATRDWPLIMTHRDLAPKNVLVADDGRPIVVDWDTAGPWTAVEEYAAAAAEWSGGLAGPANRAAAEAVRAGYRRGGGSAAVTGPEVFAGWLVKNANWTEMHVRHALDDTLPDARRQAAERLAPALLAQLVRITASVSSWTEWIGE